MVWEDAERVAAGAAQVWGVCDGQSVLDRPEEPAGVYLASQDADAQRLGRGAMGDRASLLVIGLLPVALPFGAEAGPFQAAGLRVEAGLLLGALDGALQ